MIFAIKILFLLLSLIAVVSPAPLANHEPKQREVVPAQRMRRQIDLTVSAEHDDKEDETEIALEAIANLWRSNDGNTQIEGSAKVLHKSNSSQNGNTSYSARLHLHHDYRKRK